MRHRHAKFIFLQNRVIYIAGLYLYTEPRVAVIEFSNRVMVKLELLPGTRVLLLPLDNTVKR